MQFGRSVASCHQNAELRFPSAITARCHVCLFTRVRHHSLCKLNKTIGAKWILTENLTQLDLIINRLNGELFKRVMKYQTDSGYFQKLSIKDTSFRKANKILNNYPKTCSLRTGYLRIVSGDDDRVLVQFQ